MTDETPNPAAPEPDPPAPGAGGDQTPRRASTSADVRPRRPDYRGEELDPERGPGLGCFWFQVIVLGFFIVIIPVGLNLGWPFEVLAILLFVVIGLLLLTGQTVIFLLRLVAADRRAQGRRRPLASPTKTVGELEDEQGGPPSRPARATARPEGPVEPASAAEPAGAVEPAADAEPGPTADQVLPVDSESMIRARRAESWAPPTPPEPAVGEDVATPSAAGPATSVAGEARGEPSIQGGTSDASPLTPAQDSLTARQQGGLAEPAEPAAPDAAAEPTEPAAADAAEPAAAPDAPEPAAATPEPPEPEAAAEPRRRRRGADRPRGT